MSNNVTEQTKRQKLLHHLAVGAGFCFLIAWFYLWTRLGFIDWITGLFPESHSGSGSMIAIMICMVPGFFMWKLWTRFAERKLEIKGIYYEDAYYNSEIKKPDEESK